MKARHVSVVDSKSVSLDDGHENDDRLNFLSFFSFLPFCFPVDPAKYVPPPALPMKPTRERYGMKLEGAKMLRGPMIDDATGSKELKVIFYY